MFIGHFGVGLGAKKVAPQISLGTLFIAAQFVDLLWPLLLLLGWESVLVEPGNTVMTPLNFVNYPISHSLLSGLLWGGVTGGIYYLLRKDRPGALWLGALVLSHWILDFLTHRPDLPLYPGGMKVGLGLWNSMSGTLLLEGGIFVLGVYFYLKATRAKDKIGVYAFWGLIAFLVVVHAGNVFGPPPPADSNAIALAGFAQWLLVGWGYWVDRHRERR